MIGADWLCPDPGKTSAPNIFNPAWARPPNLGGLIRRIYTVQKQDAVFPMRAESPAYHIRSTTGTGDLSQTSLIAWARSRKAVRWMGT